MSRFPTNVNSFEKVKRLLDRRGLYVSEYCKVYNEVYIYLNDRGKALNIVDCLDKVKGYLSDIGVSKVMFLKGECRLARVNTEDIDEDLLNFLAYGHLSESAYERTLTSKFYWDFGKHLYPFNKVEEQWKWIEDTLNKPVFNLGAKVIKIENAHSTLGKVADIQFQILDDVFHMEQYVRYLVIHGSVDPRIKHDMLKAVFCGLFKTFDVYRIIYDGDMYELNDTIMDYDNQRWFLDKDVVKTLNIRHNLIEDIDPNDVVWVSEHYNETNDYKAHSCMICVDGSYMYLHKPEYETEWEMVYPALYRAYPLEEVIENNRKYDKDKQYICVEVEQLVNGKITRYERYNPNAELIIHMNEIIANAKIHSNVSVNEDKGITHKLYNRDGMYLHTIESNPNTPNALYIKNFYAQYNESDFINKQYKEASKIYIGCLCALDKRHIIETDEYGELPLYMTDGGLYEYDGTKEQVESMIAFNDVKEDWITRSVPVNDTLTLNTGEVVNIIEMNIAYEVLYTFGYYLVADDGRVFITSSIKAKEEERGNKVMNGTDSLDWFGDSEVLREISENITINEIPNRPTMCPNELTQLMEELDKMGCMLVLHEQRYMIYKIEPNGDRKFLFRFVIEYGGNLLGLNYPDEGVDMKEYEDFIERFWVFLEKLIYMKEYHGVGNWIRYTKKRELEKRNNNTTRLSLT